MLLVFLRWASKRAGSLTHLDISSCAVFGFAAALIDEVPGEEGGVLAVGDACDGVFAAQNGLHAVLVQLDDLGVGPEVVTALGLQWQHTAGVPAPAINKRVL